MNVNMLLVLCCWCYAVDIGARFVLGLEDLDYERGRGKGNGLGWLDGR